MADTTRHPMTVCRLMILALTAAATAVPAVAQEPWAGKTLTMIVGSEAGSGYDTYARVVARHLGRHVPGKPTLVVQNMGGAGSKRAAEHIALLAPKDGSTIALLFPGAIADPLITERAKWRYDPTTLEFLGTADNGTRLCATFHTSKVKTFEDARRETVLIGASAPGGSTFDYPTMINALAGTRFKVVAGYKGTTDIAVAIERGEVDGWCGIEVGTFQAVRPTWLPQKLVNPLVQLGMTPNPAMTALGIPSIWQFVPQENKAAMELIVSQQVFQRPFVAPPGTPADRMDALRTAFMATMADAEFKSEAQRLRLEVNAKSGPEVAALVKRMYQSPRETVEKMAKAVRAQ